MPRSSTKAEGRLWCPKGAARVKAIAAGSFSASNFRLGQEQLDVFQVSHRIHKMELTAIGIVPQVVQGLLKQLFGVLSKLLRLDAGRLSVVRPAEFRCCHRPIAPLHAWILYGRDHEREPILLRRSYSGWTVAQG
jgi:hypothetical protein